MNTITPFQPKPVQPQASRRTTTPEVVAAEPRLRKLHAQRAHDAHAVHTYTATAAPPQPPGGAPRIDTYA